MCKRLNGRHVFIFITLLLIGYTIWRKEILSNNARYTIGVTGEISWTVASGRKLMFSYMVNGKLYSEEENFINEAIKNNCDCRYFVKYNYNNPSYGKLLQDKPVPDSIQSAPPNGWKKIPGE